MPGGGRLSVRIEDVVLGTMDAGAQGNHRRVRVDVADTGVGIPLEFLDRIFEPFYTTKEEGRGTGLGLATAYGFAKQSGGALLVHSEVGVGTSFSLELPIDG